MTEQDLMSLIHIQARIQRVKRKIAELEDENGLGSVNMDGMPHSKSPGKPVERMAVARAALHEELQDLEADLIEKEIALVRYIKGVNDHDICLIMELRFIDKRKWADVAVEYEELTGEYADRTTLYKRVKKYLFEHTN